MAYIDKLTTLQRFVAWKQGHNIHFEGVLIDEHILVGRYIGDGYPILSVDLTELDEDIYNELESIFDGYEFKIIDKPKEIEPRVAFEESNK